MLKKGVKHCSSVVEVMKRIRRGLRTRAVYR